MSLSGTVRVLHVDDEPNLADTAAELLEREDDRIDVRTAHSPGDALEVLDGWETDCIVSDYDMPGRNGIEFLRTVRETYPELPFILYTGKGSEEIASDAVSAGVTDYLQKETGTGQYAVLANRIKNAVESYRSKRAAQRTERRLSELAEKAEEALFIVDGDWEELLFINSTYEEVMRRPTEELEEDPRSFLNYVYSEDVGKAWGAMEELLGGEKSDTEFRVVRPDGERRWVHADAQPVLNEDGDVVRIVGHVKDITERKERGIHLETVIDNLPGYVYRHKPEPDYRLEFVKGDAESVTGYTATELEEEVVFAEEIIHPEDRAEVREDDMDSPGDEFDMTYRIITKEGDVRWIRDQSQIIEDPTTGEEVVEGFITDVSDRIRRKREIERQQALINQGIDSLRDVFYVLDSNGELIHWNESLPEVTGYSDEEIEEMDAPEFFPEEEVTKIVGSIEEVITTGTSEIRVELLTADGERTPFEFRGTRLTYPNEGETVLVGMGRNISEQVERERELERIRDLFAEAERLGNLGAWEFDADGNVTWTDGTRRIHEVDEGFSPEVEESIRFFHPDDREKMEQAVEAALEEGESYSIELRLITEEDNERWVRVRAEPLPDREPKTVRGFMQDITERKEREQELRSRNERLEEFAGVVSHDLRNPLGVVSGRLEIIRGEYESEHLDAIESAVDRMGEIINDLLWLAREGRKIGSKESVSVQGVVEQAWGITADDTPGASLRFPEDDLGTAEADRDRLLQMAENMLRNAIEHGGDDVTVTVGTTDGGFYIQDDGPGIPESDREDVFGSGFTTSQDGTGFGLPIVKRICEAHGWEITVDESDAGGARFEVTGVESLSR